MVANSQSGKTAIMIPVRLASSRLREKALLRVLGKTMIEHLIDRVKHSSVKRVILCTTTEKTDDRLVDIAHNNDIECFRGDTNDILARYYAAAVRFDIDYIVNVDGDDILCEPAYISKMAEVLESGEYDYVYIEGLPIGFYPVGIKTAALKKVCEIKDDENTEGWGRYFLKTGLFSLFRIDAPEKHKMNDLRLTLDYEQDYELISGIIKLLDGKKPFFIDDILDLLRNQPELIKVNDAVKQIYWKNFNAKYSDVKLKDVKE